MRYTLTLLLVFLSCGGAESASLYSPSGVVTVGDTDTLIELAGSSGVYSKITCTNDSTQPVYFGAPDNTIFPVCSSSSLCPSGNKFVADVSNLWARVDSGKVAISCIFESNKTGVEECRPRGFVDVDARKLVGVSGSKISLMQNAGSGGDEYSLEQTSSGQQPLFRAAGDCQGGSAACVDFVGTNDFMKIPAAISDTWGREIYCIDGYFPTAASNKYIFAWHDDISRTTLRNTTTGLELYGNTSGTPRVAIPQGWHSVCFDYTDPTSVPLAIDGILAATISTTSSASLPFYFIFGAYSSAGAGDYAGFQLGRFTAYKSDPQKTVEELSACGKKQWAMSMPHRQGVTLTVANAYYGLQNTSVDIFGRSMVLFSDPKDQEFSFSYSDSSTQVIQSVGKLRISPASVGDFTMTADVNGFGSINFPFYISNLAGINPFSVVMVGDSITAAQLYPDRVGANSTGKITALGTQGVGTLHEGHSGWYWRKFTETGSPFVSAGVVDIASYISTIGANPDYVIWLLGTNRIYTTELDVIEYVIDDEIAAANQLIGGSWPSGTIHAIALTMPGGESDSGFVNADRWQWRQKQHAMNRKIISVFGERESDGIYLIPTNTALDPKLSGGDYSTGDSIHPSASGYRDLADAVTGWIFYMSRS